MPPNSHWLSGHLKLLSKPFEESLYERSVNFADEKGRTGYWLMNTPYVAVTHWEDAQQVLHSEYTRVFAPLIQKYIGNFLGPHSMGLLTGRLWKYERSAILRSFHASVVQASQRDVVKLIKTLVTALKEKIHTCEEELILDVEPLMKMITLDALGLSAFSHNFSSCKTLTLSPMAQALDRLGSDVVRRVASPLDPRNFFYSLPTQANRQHHRDQHLLRTFLAEQIQRRHDKSSENDKKTDLLTVLLEAHRPSSSKLWDNAQQSADVILQDVLLSLLFAGFDTTSILLTYTLYLISQHPQIQQHCLDEIEREGVQNPERLVYMRGVLYEVLRLYPPGYTTSRNLQRDLCLSEGVVLKKGTTVLIPIWIMHRHEYNFPQPLEFRPDRWVQQRRDGSGIWVERQAKDVDKSSIPPANRDAFLAFSAGARSCPGYKFAWAEALLGLAGLLQELTFSAVPGYQLKPTDNGIVQRPEGGMPMQISLRES